MPLPIPAPREEGYTRTTAVPLYWCAYGEPGAPRLLVLHGGPGASHDYLLPQMLRLAERHDVVLYDQRGGGRSRTDDRTPVGWRTQVEDLARIVEELGVAPLSLVGYSWGGLLAMLYAVCAAGSGDAIGDGGDEPAPRPRVAPARLVLIDPAPVSREWRQQFESEFARRSASPEIQAMRAELVASGLREQERDRDAYRQRAFELSVAGYFADPRAARNLTPFRVMGRVQQSVWESLGSYDLRAALERVRAPAIVLHGREDPIPLASSEAAARALGARLVVLDGSGHVPYVERPDALFAAIDEFLGASVPAVRG